MGSWPVLPIRAGNATGLSTRTPGLTGKQLELLKAAVPQVSRVTVLYNPVTPWHILALQEAREAARALAMELQVLEVRQPNDLASAFAALRAWRTGAVRGARKWAWGRTPGVAAAGGGPPPNQPPAADCLQRPLRSRFRQRLRRSVRRIPRQTAGEDPWHWC